MAGSRRLSHQPHPPATSCTRASPSPYAICSTPKIICDSQHTTTMSQGPGPILRAWYAFRMTRFPWRKKRLVGMPSPCNDLPPRHPCPDNTQATTSRATHSGSSRTSCTPCACGASPSTAGAHISATSKYLVRAFPPSSRRLPDRRSVMDAVAPPYPLRPALAR